MDIKYTNIFHCKTLQKLPKLGFLVSKQTIWHPLQTQSHVSQRKHLKEVFFFSEKVAMKTKKTVAQKDRFSRSRYDYDKEKVFSPIKQSLLC
jgi:hypothetical protein